MKKFLLFMLAIVTMTFVACSDDDDTPTTPEGTAETCNDGILNNGETEIDCGGPNCQPCTVTVNPTCTDGIQNGDEAGIDCGGSCPNLCPGSVVVVSESITADTTWSSDTVIELDGRIFVESGATLTIEAGTLIKANAGTGTNASVLVVARGATLIADGTADAPIIFTSAADNIAFGEVAGTNLDQNDRGLWGGLIVLGNAQVSVSGDAGEAQIEGIPADDTRGLYGGSDNADGAGTIIDYVSIRHGGALIGEGNEINGLTLGGVGTGAVISNIEVVANVDDGIEFFGGSVNASNLFVWAQGDDALDIDQAYSGTITNAIVVLGDASDHGLEIDGPEGSLQGEFTIDGLTMFGNANTSNGEYADYRSNAQGATNNVYAVGFPAGKDAELDNNAVTTNYNNGILTFSNWQIVGAGAEIFAQKVGCAQNCDDDDDDNDIDEVPVASTFEADAAGWTTTVMEGANTVGATTADFAWTFSNTKAGLGF
ncbi:hypothetical protein [Croceitalea rosinachiae]|uniref:Uncharacterized protein n=1 Tax=Croceitalea rosinachiae TaxID=3075596 RepID=A0ABU3A9U9_9FLAO|nr:hypothetical protein [Croceitalea sp. F388]MDT0606663.1 hypothetical protein [Croceitalea sp. F388]